MKKRAFSSIAIVLLLTMIMGLMAACDTSTPSATQTAGAQTPATTDAATVDPTTPANDGKVYQLSLSQHDPASSTKTKYHIDWADRIREASDGRLDITVFSDGVLASGTGQLDALRTGVCDIAWAFPIYWAGQFPVSEVVTLPIGLTTVPQATNILWDLYETEPALQEEIDEFIPLQIHTNPVSILASVNKPIYTVDDLKSMKMRAPGGAPTDCLLAWGATPMQMAPGDIFQAAERGTVDGFIFEWSGISSFSLKDVTNYFTEVPIYLGPYYLFMTKDSFNSLPADLQDILMSFATREESMEMAYVFEGDARKGRNEAIEAGCTVITREEAETDGFLEIANQTVLAAWIENYDSPDFDANAFIEKVTELGDKYFLSTDELYAGLDERGL